MRPAEEKRCRCHRLQHTPLTKRGQKWTPWAVAPPAACLALAAVVSAAVASAAVTSAAVSSTTVTRAGLGDGCCCCCSCFRPRRRLRRRHGPGGGGGVPLCWRGGGGAVAGGGGSAAAGRCVWEHLGTSGPLNLDRRRRRCVLRSRCKWRLCRRRAKGGRPQHLLNLGADLPMAVGCTLHVAMASWWCEPLVSRAALLRAAFSRGSTGWCLSLPV